MASLEHQRWPRYLRSLPIFGGALILYFDYSDTPIDGRRWPKGTIHRGLQVEDDSLLLGNVATFMRTPDNPRGMKYIVKNISYRGERFKVSSILDLVGPRGFEGTLREYVERIILDPFIEAAVDEESSPYIETNADLRYPFDLRRLLIACFSKPDDIHPFVAGEQAVTKVHFRIDDRVHLELKEEDSTSECLAEEMMKRGDDMSLLDRISGYGEHMAEIQRRCCQVMKYSRLPRELLGCIFTEDYCELLPRGKERDEGEALMVMSSDGLRCTLPNRFWTECVTLTHMLEDVDKSDHEDIPIPYTGKIINGLVTYEYVGDNSLLFPCLELANFLHYTTDHIARCIGFAIVYHPRVLFRSMFSIDPTGISPEDIHTIMKTEKVMMRDFVLAYDCGR
jgi:hypothetical protein